MADTVIKLENISKQYRLGLVSSKTLRGDITSWYYRTRGKEDPTLKIGEENRLDNQVGEYVWSLRDINLEVKQGEILGIIGKNGAGKLTLLKLLSRVTAPTTGTIKAKGRIASLLEVGTGMHPELTGRENIYLNGAILGMTKAEIKSKLEEIVDFAGIAKYIDTPVKRYSSGMHVRLGFAVAAHLEPEILIVDEVLAVGDAEFQKKAIGKMQDISKGGGRTVLFVSHNMTSVKNLCQNAIILENGQIVSSGDATQMVNEYLSRNNPGLILKNNQKIEDKYFDLLSAEVVSSNQIITNGDELSFQFYIHKKEAIDFSVIILFYMDETLAFFSTDFHLSLCEEAKETGKYLINFKTPSYFFNSGTYTIDFKITDFNGNSKQFLLAQNVLSFAIEDDLYRRGGKYNLGWNGVLSPILDAEISKP